MTIAYDGKVYEDEASFEVATNSNIPADFKERFEAVQTPVKTPPEAPTEPAGALESSGSTETPAEAPKPNSGVIYPEPYGLNPPESTMSFRPSASGILSGLVRSALSGMALPGDVYQGKVDPDSIQAIERAADLATLTVMGPAPLAKKMADGTLGSFAGVRSKGYDKQALEVAQLGEKRGLTPDEIWQKTGWFKGADKRWRYEIDDSGSTFTPIGSSPKLPLNEPHKLKDVLDHPELYEAYPGIENIKVKAPTWYPDKGAHWDGSTIVIGKEAAKDKSTLMHEVQHAIQDREAFAQGGVPGKSGKNYKLKYEEEVDKYRKEYLDLQKEADKGPLSPAKLERLDYFRELFYKYAQYARAGDIKARENYMALAGETEARNVETRLPLEPKDRASISPMSTEDVVRSEQIIRDTPTLATPYRGKDGFLSY